MLVNVWVIFLVVDADMYHATASFFLVSSDIGGKELSP